MADPAQIRHLLRRTEFVTRPERVNALVGGTLAAAVDDILAIDPAPVPLPSYVQSTIPAEVASQWVYMTHWWIDRMLDAQRPMQEKMTLFWHGHFTSGWSKVGDTASMTSQNALYRTHSVGNFYALTQAMSVQPAMLRYLDNADNLASSPNQNFARELMELFTLGVGNYTEADVEASARAWTGHTLNPATSINLQYQFRPELHDNGPKTFFGTTKNWDGPEIINEILIDNPTSRQRAARFMVNKLWEFFAHTGTPTAVIDALAPMLASDWEIRPVLRAMLLRNEFYSASTLQGKVRSPVEWIVAAMYHCGFRSTLIQPYYFALSMGHTLLDPPDVSGWKNDTYWLNAGSFSGRTELAWQLTFRLRSAGVLEIKGLSTDVAISTVGNAFGIESFSTATRNAMTNYLNAQRAAEPWGGWWESTGLVMMALMSPEMHVV